MKITKAFNDIKEKKPIEGDSVETVNDMSKDVEDFLTYVLIDSRKQW